MPPCSNLGPPSQMNTGIAILQQNRMKGCAVPPMHLASFQTVAQNCDLWDMRLTMEDGKAKPGNLLEQGFISFLPEKHMLITECNIVL